MHAGLVPLLDVGVRALSWDWDPSISVPLLAGGAIYLRGIAIAWAHPSHRGIRARQVASFVAGWLALVLALLSPIHAASEQLFSAHMIQHELLMVVAAPLLVLGRPALVMLWAVPPAARSSFGRLARRSPVRRTWQALTRPFDAWLLHGAVIWGWHVPFLFQATLYSDAAHAAQHLSFLGSALLFWWTIIHPSRRSALGMSVVYLFTTAVHTGVLGALMAFSHTPWYPAYGQGGAAWGLTPLTDQQLAGLIMWIPASVAYLVGALVVIRRWLTESENRVARQERLAVAFENAYDGSDVSYAAEPIR